MELIIQIGLGIALGSLVKFAAETAYLPIQQQITDRARLKDINQYQQALGKPLYKSIKEYNDAWLADIVNAEVESAKPKTARKSRTTK